jgi:DNA polymerase III subunit gamma/tau
MAEQVFYRKHRPKLFSEIIGQKHVVQTLTNAISSDKVSHAYLFCGPRGSGKTTIARLLAKSVNCENRKGFEPCNKCSSCLEIIKGSSMDLVEIDAASHRGIDEIRELKEGIKFAPTKSKKKIYIIDEAHQLTKEAFNALLKILEEAPEHAMFILATTEAQKMIATIISRCQRFNFNKLTVSEIIERLEIIARKEGIKLTKEALTLIASNSDGAIRDAESLLGQVFSFVCGGDKEKQVKAEDIGDLLGLVETGLVSHIVDLILEKKVGESLNYLNGLVNKGKDLHEFTKRLLDYSRKILLVKIVGDADKKNSLIESILVNLTDEDFEKLKKQADSFSEVDLRKALDLLIDAQSRMKYSSIPQLPLELAIVEIIGIRE